MKTVKTTSMVLLALFSGIIFLLAFTPLGFIQLPFIKATIVHVPVIVGAVLMGPKKGAFLGALFGLTSLINNTLAPAAMSFAFSPLIPVPGTAQGSPLALVTCFVPRILVGVVPYFVAKAFEKGTGGKGKIFAYAAAGVSGALTNTLLVMNGIYFIFTDAFAQARNIPVSQAYAAVMTVVIGNGIPEAIVAGVVAGSVCRILVNSSSISQMLAESREKPAYRT